MGEHTEILNEGDSILYNSSTPHGMIAVGGKECVFCAVVISGEETDERAVRELSLIHIFRQEPVWKDCPRWKNRCQPGKRPEHGGSREGSVPWRCQGLRRCPEE